MKKLEFAENLKSALTVNGKTQKELADHLGTTQQTVSRWLTGRNEPDLATLINICIYLNETPNSILGFDEIPKN
ncbi:MAG: helix-turn-helix domain-containing protein [Clostridia bacterium]|nr:helix-turn-helix domain-containing protein [Clostridia bacterium]